ncbi:ABC transporter permease [Nocardioides sp. LHD-245]|uniref:ABC transporter permease n=1 Tax=Nocardioides sp. LHD-245 TaxID=3051387 RepID=UPI0027E0824C|nr:ABC transporter permease [Nocardioides sp. LHD-245]
MIRFTVQRMLGAALTIVAATFVAFALLRLTPGDPARMILGRFAPEEAVDAQRTRMRLDDSIAEQYWAYVADFFRGDWGFSYSKGQPVREAFSARLPATIELGLLAMAVAVIAAVVGAVIAVRFQGRWPDLLVRISSYLGIGTAPFWLGIVLLVVLSDRLGLLPGPEGRLTPWLDPPPRVTGSYLIDSVLAGDFVAFGDALTHLILPTLTLALGLYAFLVRIFRAQLLEVVREPYVLVARSKGATRGRALRRDALPNSMLGAVTLVGTVVGEVLIFTVLAEKVFAWPGVGLLVTEAIVNQDFAIVQTFILFSVVSTVAISLVVDLLYGMLDPRVRAASWKRRARPGSTTMSAAIEESVR